MINIQIVNFVTGILSGERKKRLAEAAAEEERRRAFIEELERCTKQLEKVRKDYDMVWEDELIEALIYEEKALFARYAYLLRKAKENGISFKVAVKT